MNELDALYERDFSAWALGTAELLKKGCFSELDIEHLLEELTDMGASERNELESRLTVLLTHLLKWHFQYRTLSAKWQEFDGRIWRFTILEQRNRIRKRLHGSPSMKPRLAALAKEAYQDAVELASKETGLPLATFPNECPYAWEQIMDDEFYPQ